MKNYEQVTQQDKIMLMENWWNEITTPVKDKGDKVEFLHLLSKFGNMWDRHLGRTKKARHRMDLTCNARHPLYSAP